MSQTAQVSEWIEELTWEDLPPNVIRKCKQCLQDFLACAIGGTRSTPGKIAIESALQWGGPEEATIIGSPQMVAARHAAFANAVSANALDFDDTLRGHPGATTFPTALAASEKWGATGKDLVIASVIGYELSVRAMTLMEPVVPRYVAMWDLGTLQPYGATAVAARLAGLSSEGVANALGLISGTSPVPLPRKKRYAGEGRSMLKAAYGWSVDSAMVAVDLTVSGFAGPGHALDDNLGFWNLTPSSELSSFADQLGERWAILDVEFKPYMACRFIHPVLQAVDELTGKAPIASDEVERVEIQSFSLLADEHHFIPEPVSGIDAQFSVPFTVAVMLAEGKLTPESYEEKTLQDPTVLALAKRVSVQVDDDFEAAFRDQLGAHVRIISRDGQQREATIQHPKGSSEQPLGEEELGRKFRDLADPIMGEQQADRILDTVDRLDELEDLSALTNLLRRT